MFRYGHHDVILTLCLLLLLKVYPYLFQQRLSQNLNWYAWKVLEQIDEIMKHFFAKIHVLIAIDEDEGQGLVYDWRIFISIFCERIQ